MDFVIFTDTGCDIASAILWQWGVAHIDLQFRFEDEQTLVTSEMAAEAFYRKMREGKVSKTSAANPADFMDAFEPVLKSHADILYLGFSSALSNTVNAGRMAAAELLEKYPERRIVVIDTLCASAGQGLLVSMAVKKRAEGADLFETARYIKAAIPHLCHWFTVDDLVYLKRGGRVGAATAFFGGVLNIKPVLHVDGEGRLVNMQKARGRKQAIRALAEKYTETAEDPAGGVYFISHGDCTEDAKLLEAYILEAHKNPASLITQIGPVIGSHSGPGTLALFFRGKHR